MFKHEPFWVQSFTPSGRQLTKLDTLKIYSLLSFLSLVVFGVLHIVEGNKLVGYLELGGAAALLINAAGLRLTANEELARRGLLLVMFVMMLVMVATGGTKGTGVYWLFLFPVAAFFLAGRKAGLLWVSTLWVSVVALWVLEQFNVATFYYSNIEARQMLVTLAVVAIALYVYERVRESSEQKIHDTDKAKSEFVTIASHQLRTPISAVNWFSEMLLDGDVGKLSHDQQDHVQKIYQSNQRMAELVDAMLTLSSLELRNLPVRPELVDIVAEARKVVKEQLAQTDRKLTFKEHYDQTLPKIKVDQQILRLILQNLASNAIKYTPEGGYVSLEIARSGEKLSSTSQGSVAIILSDNGYGIPKSAKDKVFTKFFRAENIKSRDTDGTGLGLYVVKSLLEYTGGKITYDSHEGKGTTFVVLVPIEGVTKTDQSNVF